MSQDTSIPGGQPFPSLRELTGTVIDGRYEIGRVLGTGGMGAVYEAMQLRLDRRVAIKILNPVYMHREDYVTRFMREAKAASKIRHANVVQMMDFGELPGGSVYSVMEFLEGRDLAQLLRAEGRLPWPRTRALMLQMARGLRAAHEQGVIHRDIKPANLFLVTRRGDDDQDHEVLKILDFGIARMQSQPSQNTSALTGTAELLGTPSYMAPELARGRSANPRSEVYSVGIVAYRMLTGRLPFEGETAFDVLFRSATEAAPSMRTHDRSIPPAIDDLVMRMIAREPEQRFDQMSELYKAIQAVDEHGNLAADYTQTPTGPHVVVPQSPMTPSAAGPTQSTVTAPVPQPTPYPPPTYPTMTTARSPYMAPPPEPSHPQVVVPPPPGSTSPLAAEATAPNTGPGLDPLTPGSGLHPMPGSEITSPGLYEPTPGSMRLPTQPGGAGLSNTGQGLSYDSLAGMDVTGKSNRIWIFVGVVALLAIVLAAIMAPGDDDTKDQVADAEPKSAPKVISNPVVPPTVDEPPDAETPDAKTPDELSPTPLPPTEPTDTTPGPAPEEDDPIVIETDDPPKPEPATNPGTKPRGPKTSPTPKKSPSTGGAKSDAQVTSAMKSRIRKKCGNFLAGKTTKVGYMISPKGMTMSITVKGTPFVENCVKAEIRDTRYAASGTSRTERFTL